MLLRNNWWNRTGQAWKLWVSASLVLLCVIAFLLDRPPFTFSLWLGFLVVALVNIWLFWSARCPACGAHVYKYYLVWSDECPASLQACPCCGNPGLRSQRKGRHSPPLLRK